ncbi:sn1-specific diacylglycerol lipase alpha-like isoform X5 [Dinothrombium tinctorium]|uniref:Diacylglycerol lipase-alpha n=1 Tax=Dinothrombium tinctorium TaxID=1965070 RepID=A0A443RAY0_9ACAR|nr:sn1-specific diacylglycerol lipase alpha-like isoform X5 [Dinothrombium tinctorium]
MPGIIIFSRRWSVGSDDFIIPAIVLLTIHSIWLIILGVVLIIVDHREWRLLCMADLHEHSVGYIVILLGCIVVEACIAIVSMKGTILDTAPRASMQHLIYVRLGLFVVEIVWLIFGVIWIRRHYDTCTQGFAKKAILGITICNWSVVGSMLLTTWCTFDAAGRSWVKMKRYQNSMRDGQSKYRYRRSGNSHRNWRHRKAMRAYQDSWNRRCKLLFCCVGKSDRHQNSFSEIAKLLSEFFRDLDVVPSDVVAGLILLRRLQRIQREFIVKEKTNDTYQFLSGVAITPKTKFLDVTHSSIVTDIRTLIHYLHYAVAVYGWPMFMMTNNATGCCQLCPFLRCSRCPKKYGLTCCASNSVLDSPYPPVITGDNCCNCNYAALQRICQTHKFEVIYVTYHVSIGEPPFFVALDHEKRTIVISVRGTLSLQDVITDLNAEGEILPINPKRENWLGHRGMVEAAAYIRKKLSDEKILQKALNYRPEKRTADYTLVLVGHSLGAGTAAILAILLKQDYPDLICFAFSPPGGLLSLPATEYTKEFITSVILGKDVVPRLGLHQMESLRFDLMNAIKETQDPKWKIIGSVFCCCQHREEDDTVDAQSITEVASTNEKDLSSNPNDTSIALTVHQPMYPPGKIIHIVRNHPDPSRYVLLINMININKLSMMNKFEPVYQALWANNTDFDQILISPVMIQDHMPDKLLNALEKLLVNTGPPKPQRQEFHVNLENLNLPLLSYSGTLTPDSFNRTPSHRVVLETSFTDLQPVGLDETLDRSPPKRNERPTLLSALRFHRKIDLIHDDWIGMAPLASPETLSEVSSISSRSIPPKHGFCSSNVVHCMEPIEQSPISHGSQDISSVVTLECPSKDVLENEEDPPIEIETGLGLDVLALFHTLSTTSVNAEETNNTSDCDENESLDKKPLVKNKRVTFNLSPSETKQNSEISSKQSDSLSDEENNLAHSSSEVDLSSFWNEPLPPLRRSLEKINLVDLDDSVPIFDSTVCETKASTSKHPNEVGDNKMSPTSQLLFQKLLTIEDSPSDENPTCDAFKAEVTESNI